MKELARRVDETNGRILNALTNPAATKGLWESKL